MTTGRGRYLGIDVGTSIAKLALFDEDGGVVCSAARSVRLHHPIASQVEQDPDAVIDAIAQTVAEAGAQAGIDIAAVDIVAVTGQGDGCWLLDTDGRPVRPAISWLDARGAEVLADWERAGITDAIYRINGSGLFPGAQAPLLHWLEEYEPRSLDAATTAAYCKDMVFQRLTGERATDASDSSGPFGDGRGGYSEQALSLCGLEHRADLLAPIVAPLPTGLVNRAGARDVGLRAGVPVWNGPYDIPACAAGAGVREFGDGLITIGTTLVCQVLTDHLDTSGEIAGLTVATATPGQWIRAMPAMVGTASLDWLLTMINMHHDEIEPVLTSTVPGAAGVSVLPYLAPSGERAPFVDSAAAGQFDGVRLTTTRADLVRALCEGLAYAARQCLQAAGLTGRVVACGGGTRSPEWLRIFASVLGQPLELARSAEVGARGAVTSALRATGHDVDPDDWTSPVRVIDPDPVAARYYEDGYHRYLEQQRRARDQWHC